MYYALHHVQLTCPAGSEPVLRGFYGGVMGMTELVKPPRLAARGGAWFRYPEDGGVEFHIGVEADFRPARKGHPGVVWGDLTEPTALADRLTAADRPVEWDEELHDVPMRLNGSADPVINPGGMWRFCTVDPHGNRIELMAPRDR